MNYIIFLPFVIPLNYIIFLQFVIPLNYIICYTIELYYFSTIKLSNFSTIKLSNFHSNFRFAWIDLRTRIE